MKNPNCEQFQPLLAACADGAASRDERALVTDHVVSCGACAQALHVQQLMHQAMALRGRAAADTAPPGLRTRIAATLAAERAPVIDSSGGAPACRRLPPPCWWCWRSAPSRFP